MILRPRGELLGPPLRLASRLGLPGMGNRVEVGRGFCRQDSASEVPDSALLGPRILRGWSLGFFGRYGSGKVAGSGVGRGGAPACRNACGSPGEGVN